MGPVFEKVIIKNYEDSVKFELGFIQESEIRTNTIDAIVDTGSSYLCLPPKTIKELGLTYSGTSIVRTGNGPVGLRLFKGADIFVKDRYTQLPIMENLNDDLPALLGVLVLEAMDFVVNPITGKVDGNPDHGGEWMADMF
jgi:predicted aspartyl protease